VAVPNNRTVLVWLLVSRVRLPDQRQCAVKGRRASPVSVKTTNPMPAMNRLLSKVGTPGRVCRPA